MVKILAKIKSLSPYCRKIIPQWTPHFYRAKYRFRELYWAIRLAALGPPKNRRQLRIYHGGSKLGIGGPIVKLNRMSQYFPDEKYDYNIIYSISAHIPPHLCLRAKKRGAKIISHVNSMFYPAYRPDYMEENKPIAAIHAMADHIIYGSKFAKEAASVYLGPSDAPSTIIYNAVDTEHFRPISRTTSDHFNVLAIGVHYIQHRLKPLIQAMPIVKKVYSNARLIVAGPLVSGKGIFDCGPNTIKTVAREAGFCDIEFLGTYAQRDAPSIYSSASVMVHLKHMDWTPNTTIEAMACGVPIVHTGNGGLPELVGKAGVSLDLPFDWHSIHTPDLELLAERIVEAYENRRTLGEIARQIAVEHYDIKKWVKLHKSIFRQTLVMCDN